ncbi:MAG: hypothetical protein KJO06_06365 [Gemmatimonadetes bacterium]|nr:hypothetical protein [Gemmatimonadota bacterium]
MRGPIFSRRGGFTLMGVGPSILLWLMLSGVPAAVAPPAAFPDQFPLFPTMGNEGASGMAYLEQPWSPYGVSVDEEGRVQYDLTIEVAGLPEVDGETYRVWITTPTLDPIVGVGSIDPVGKLTTPTDWHQLMVVVSREPEERVVSEGDRWGGPIVLRGFSAGARVTPMAQHSLFQQSPM